MPSQEHVRQAIEYAQQIVIPFSQPGEPLDIELIARSLGVKEVSGADMNADGYLGRRSDGTLVIRHRNGVGKARTRFTIAHEVAHIILSEVEGKPVSIEGSYRRNPGEEKAVNRIAAELLMPSSLLVEEVREKRTNAWNTVFRLARQYRVSTSAMAFRILELPSLYAVSLRVNIDGMGLHLPYTCSEHQRIHLINGIDYELDRVWRDSKRTSHHILPVIIYGQHLSIECDGNTRSFSTRLGDVQAYWVLGWHSFNA